MREAQLVIPGTAVLIKSKSSVCVDQMCFIAQTSDRIGSAQLQRVPRGTGKIEPSGCTVHNEPNPSDVAGQTHTLRNRGIHLNLTGVRDEMERS